MGSTSAKKSSDELDEFARDKLERDLLDLQRLIGAHFEERAKDEECLVDLKDRITERKEMREAQIKERARKQQERDMIKKMEKERKMKKRSGDWLRNTSENKQWKQCQCPCRANRRARSARANAHLIASARRRSCRSGAKYLMWITCKRTSCLRKRMRYMSGSVSSRKTGSISRSKAWKCHAR